MSSEPLKNNAKWIEFLRNVRKKKDCKKEERRYVSIEYFIRNFIVPYRFEIKL